MNYIASRAWYPALTRRHMEHGLFTKAQMRELKMRELIEMCADEKRAAARTW